MEEVYSNIGRLNHVAIAVPDIKIASDMWQKALRAFCHISEAFVILGTAIAI